MEVYEKLKLLRLYRGWSQDKMAEKLGYSSNGYAKIERGETDIKVDQLGKIAAAIGVDLQQLLNLNDQNVFNVIENFTHSNNIAHGNILLSETQCAHELEKAHLIITLQQKELALKDKELAMQAREIILLEQKIADQQKIINFLENKPA